MTQERIRELLSDVADAVPAPDVADRAWRRSVRVRRRRVAGTSLLAAGVVAAVVAVVGVVGDAQPGVPPPDKNQVAVPQPVPEAAKARDPDGHVARAPAWVGPSIQEEERLPRLASELPPSIDLAADVVTTDKPGRAVAAFAASDSDPLEYVMIVGRDGDVSRLDLEESLGRTENDKGDSFLALNISSLSPDGRYLAFAQQEEVVLYDLVEGGDPDVRSNQGYESWNVGWTKYEGVWQVQLVEDLMNPDTGYVTDIVRQEDGSSPKADSPFPVEQRIWPARTNAEQRDAQTGKLREGESRFLDGLDDPLLVTVDGPRPALLALPNPEGSGFSPRSRVIDWLGSDLLAFQSLDYGTFRVLGWDTGSGAVSLLSEVELPDDWDHGVIASWSDVAR